MTRTIRSVRLLLIFSSWPLFSACSTVGFGEAVGVWRGDEVASAKGCTGWVTSPNTGLLPDSMRNPVEEAHWKEIYANKEFCDEYLGRNPKELPYEEAVFDDAAATSK
jgi:hypothetical protein